MSRVMLAAKSEIDLETADDIGNTLITLLA
jgi:hypothetical protein